MKRRLHVLFTLIFSICILSCGKLAADADAGIVASGSCGSNVTWTLDENGLLTIAGTGAMQDYSSNIGSSWSGHANLVKSVVVEDGVTSIGKWTFYGSGLESVTVAPSVKTIGYHCFENCTCLSTVELSEGVETISAGAFRFCYSLERLELPDGLIEIGNDALHNCTGLTYLKIPSSVTTVWDQTLSGCSGLKTAGPIGSGSNLEFGWTDTIPDFSFAAMPSLVRITLPEGLSTIPGSAFKDCDTLKSVEIPNGVTRINSYAFASCDSLESIMIPAAVTTVASDAFNNCSNLKTVYFSGDYTQWQRLAAQNAVLNKAREYHYDPNGSKTGNCGNGLNWSLTDSGLLLITGSGQMWNFDSSGYNGIPWIAFRDQILRVIVDEGVTSIGNNAFQGCPNLKSVTISSGVQSIGSGVFSECQSLSSIDLGNVTGIGARAFENCTSLTRFTISDAITTIRTRTFYGCSTLTEISIPESVTGIEEYAFSECSSLAAVSLPPQLTSLGAGTFRNCHMLTQITIPDSVQTIPNYAFYGCSGLTDVSIPASIASINYCAFEDAGLTDVYYGGTQQSWSKIYINEYGNDELKNAELHCEPVISGTWGALNWTLDDDGLLTISGSGAMNDFSSNASSAWLVHKSNIVSAAIENGVTTVGAYAFQGCTGLTEISLPESMANIGINAFENCTALTEISIPGNVTEIAGYAFKGCTGLADITIPNSVTSIGGSAFQGCMSLSAISIPDSVTDIGEAVFQSCTGLMSITLSSSLTEISTSAFQGCTNLTGVAIPDNVTRIGDYAFQKCIGMLEIVLPDGLESIGNYSFQTCTGLTEIVIPVGVTSIGNDAFSGCSCLTEIIIPNGLTSIGDDVFYNCSNISSLTLPASLTEIGYRCFYNCSALKSAGPIGSDCNIEYGWTTEIPARAFHASKITNIMIPTSITGIGDYAFSACSGLTEITIPTSVTSIGNSAFSNCSNLTNVVIQEGVEEIGSNAFQGCSNLTAITLPASMTRIGTNAFYNCNSLITVYFVGTPDQWYSIAINSGNDPLKNSSIHRYYLGSGTVGENLSWVLEGDGVLTISGSGPMDELEMDEGWKPYLEGIYSVVIKEGITSIANYNFYDWDYCSAAPLESIIIPTSVTSIDSYAFFDCYGLTEITIPASVISIGNSAFYGCTSLTEMTIPASVDRIDDNAFSWCTNLTSVVIQEGVTEIGNSTFQDCTSLTEIIIPSSVTRIGTYAFYNCSSLSDIYYGGTEDQWNSLIESNSSYIENATLHCFHTITVAETTNGSVTAEVDGEEVPGSVEGKSILLRFSPNQGFELDSVSYNDGSDHVIPEIEGTYSFTMPNENVTVTATFREKVTYAITVSECTNGIVTADKESAAKGEAVILIIVPDPGYELDTLVVKQSDTPVTVANKQFVMPDGDVTISATFIRALIPYVNENGIPQQPLADYTIVNADMTTMNSGWYVVMNSVTSYNRLSVSGDVSLLLCDEASFNLPKGISVTGSNSLTIYGQSEGNGRLIINGPESNAAGIGGNWNEPCGTICINGGTVNTQGAAFAAGIGGGGGKRSNYSGDASGGIITINGGTITAEGGSGNEGAGAGIGGGYRGPGGKITISGGTITAEGGLGGAGIGGGYRASGGNITISGGNVNAFGSGAAAGIGGGIEGSAGEISITGGSITAVSSSSTTSAIGAGCDGYGGTISITGGSVTAGDIGSSEYGEGNTNITLGWTNSDDYIKAKRYFGTVTISTGKRLMDETDNSKSFAGSVVNISDLTNTRLIPDQRTFFFASTVTPENGALTTDKAEALEGETVTLTVTPDNGYMMVDNSISVTYTDEGQTKSVTTTQDTSDNSKYTFTMPAANVSISAAFRLQMFTITWKYDDGSVIDTTTVEYGVVPSHADATKEATAEFTYSFAGWTPELSAVTCDAEYTATFDATINEYMVVFKDEDDTILQSGKVKYGEMPIYTEEIPTKVATAQYTYSFAGWEPELAAVTGDAAYTATYSEELSVYTVSFDADGGAPAPEAQQVAYGGHAVQPDTNPSKEGYSFTGWYVGETPYRFSSTEITGDITLTAKWKGNEYTVIWVNDDGSMIDITTVEHGVIPTHEAPVKQADEQYVYTFAGWDPEPQPATGVATYRASYTKTVIAYTITWLNEDGSVLDTTTVEYGTVPTHADASKSATAEYTYIFAGWTPEVVSVTGDATYKAMFTETRNIYAITWLNDDGSVIDTTTVEYGAVPSHTDAVKEATAEFTYSFAGWTPELSAVTGNATYTATFDATVNEYTVVFKDEDDTILQSGKVKYGEMPVYTEEIPTKAATAQYTYSFAGWEPELAAVTGDAAYTATYSEELNVYTVSFDADGGTPAPEVQQVAYGGHAVQPDTNPSKEGYSFTGWYAGETPYRFSSTEIIGDITLTAKWKGNEYTVIWVSDDGSMIDITTVEHGVIPTHEAPDKQADEQYVYTFAGWDPEPQPATSVTTYRASYTTAARMYAITIDSTDPNGTVTTSDTAAYQELVTLTVTPADGYETDHVSYNDGTNHDLQPDENDIYSFTMPAKDVTVTVTFSLKSFKIFYDANGGDNAPELQEKTPGKPIILSPAIPAREEWYFIGWSEHREAVEAVYRPGEIFSTDADTTLYAVWCRPDFILPAALTEIREDAFSGGAFTFVKLPDNAVSIGSRAFAECPNLTCIIIPADVEEIDADAFENVRGMTILGIPGTRAQTYAQEKDFYFVPIA